jgi:hypothetical protein
MEAVRNMVEKRLEYSCICVTEAQNFGGRGPCGKSESAANVEVLIA